MSTLLIASRYLFGRKLRTFLTTLAIIFGVFVIFGMNTLIPTMLDAFMSSAISASGQVDVTITQKTDDAFSKRILDKVTATQGVKTAAGYLKRTVNLPENYVDGDSSAPDEISAVTLVGLDNDAFTLHTYDVADGRFIRSSDDDRAVITTTLADAFGVGLGDTFKLPTTVGTIELTVTGLLPARAIPGNEEVIVSLYEAQKLLDMEGQINVIEANLATTDEAARAQIVSAIEARLGRNFKVGAITTGSELLSNLAVAQIGFSMFGVFALLMGGFIIFNTFRTIVAERRRDIGVLRSIGASRRTIVGLILAEGLLQGIVGTVIGIAIGYFLAVLILTALAPIYKSFVHLTIKTTPVVPPSLVVVTILVGIGVTLFAGFLPALSASRVSPLEALRPSVAETVRKRKLTIPEIAGIVLVVLALAALVIGNIGLTGLGVLMFLAGLVLVSPALLDPIARLFGSLVALAFAREGTGSIAQANLSRQPTRAAITASATMIGLAIIVAMIGVIVSLEGAFIEVLRNSLGSDYLLTPPALSIWDDNVGSNADFADRLRNTRGVEAVSTLRVASSEVKGQLLTVMGIDPENYPKVSSLTFTEGDPNMAYTYLAAGRTVILNGIIASRIGVKVGDDIRILTPTGSTLYRVIGIGGDYLNAKLPTAYISQANLAKDFRKDEDVFIQLNLEKGADPARVEPQIRKIMGDYPQFKLISGREFFESNKVLMQQSFIGIYVMMWLLAVPSLIAMVNTLAIAVIERTREIGMMRATGATRRQVGTTILAEAVLLASVGTVLGVAGGLYLGYVLVNAMVFAGYPATYYFPTDGVIAAIVAGLVFGAIAAVIPARQAARLKIIQALQYE
jgi:putative ABC transport system permease protein